MGNARIVRVDHSDQRLLVGVPVWSQRQAIDDLYRSETASRSNTMLNALMHLAGPMRREYLGRAVGYGVGLLPFDRSLNIWNLAGGK